MLNHLHQARYTPGSKRHCLNRFIVWIPKSNNLQNLKALLNMVELSGERDISAYAKLYLSDIVEIIWL